MGLCVFASTKNPPIETVGFCALIGNLESVPNRSTLVCSEPTKGRILSCRVGGFGGAVIGDLFPMCSDAVGVSRYVSMEEKEHGEKTKSH